MNKEAEKELEERLLKRVAKKDGSAFEQLYELTSKSIFFYLYRLLQDRETAEDLHMEVYAAVWKNAQGFKGKSRVKTWMFGIARNMAMNELRKHHRKTLRIDKPVRDENSFKAYKEFERHDSIQAALAQLSYKHREILDLVFFHGQSYSDISKLLAIPENTVKTRVYYAKAALKEEICKTGG
ncbi:MAG: sigma-70 family RNA polymerase sigma factor [Desulfobacteraceae bacterium]